MNPNLLIDISGTPAQIAAARLERIAKDVLDNAGLSDQAKERAALKVMECDPVEVRREVIRQLPDLLKRLVKDSDLAGAARIRNAQWRLLTADPMLEAAPTADAQVSRFMREISDDMASGWNEAHLVGYCLRELPIETVPYLIQAITKRLTDSQSGMKAVQVSVLERVRIGLNKLHTKIQNVKELIERETNPQRQAHVFLDAFVIGDADLEPDDYEMADLIGKQAAKAITQLLSPDALRALTPLVLARLEALIPEVSVYASDAPAWQKSTLSDIREARLRAELPFDEPESAALLHFLERLSTFYLGS